MDTTYAGAARRPRASALVALALAGATALAGIPGYAAAGSSTPTVQLQTVIVTGGAGVFAAVRAAGGTVLDSLPLIGGVSAQLPSTVQLPPQFEVVPDRSVRVSGTSASAGPVSTVRGTLGLGAPAGEGAGVTVAVVDTGVADVADLAGRVTHVDVTGEGAGDGYGHGTFVAGLVAGNGASSDGEYAGVAPGAHILDVRVADDDGNSSLLLVLKGLEAVAADHKVDVLNLSLSSESPLPYQIDPLTVALEALWRRGVTVVVSAGNDGDDGPGSISSPGNDPVVLTVGGLDENATPTHADDAVPSWSSQGPAAQGVAKPEIVAPGTHLVSTATPGSAIWGANASARVGADYFKGSGTSFSSAVTAGAAAVLLQERKNLSPDQVKAVLTRTAYNVAGQAAASGAGGLNLTAALEADAPKVKKADTLPPGSTKAWQQFLDALLAGDYDEAASSWSRLSPVARQWAASSWSELSPDARQWAARQWAARQWADDPRFDGDQWLARQWAARQWAASSWSASSWSASSWSSRLWEARQWAASDWAASSWSASSWSASSWSARQWSARQWSARQWSASSWSARQWSARQWSARQWSARNWD